MAESSYTPKNTVKDLNEQARARLLLMANDPEAYKSFLETVAKFPSYSAFNATHIHEAAPNAYILKDAETWFNEKNPVATGQEGIPVTYPEASKKGTFFKVKYLFSETQVQKPIHRLERVFNEKLLQEAFSQAQVERPSSTEGKFIVGQHFGIGGYLKEGALPPADLMATDDVNEACDNIKNYVDDIRRDANRFIRNVEGIYKGLITEQTQDKNSNFFNSLKKSAERQEQQNLSEMTPEQIQAELNKPGALADERPKVTVKEVIEAVAKDFDSKLEAAEVEAEQANGQQPNQAQVLDSKKAELGK